MIKKFISFVVANIAAIAGLFLPVSIPFNASQFLFGEFKDEVQHGSEIHETPGTAS